MKPHGFLRYRDAHALLTGLTELAIERFSPLHKMTPNGMHGMAKNAMDMGKEVAENPLTSLLQQNVLDRGLLGTPGYDWNNLPAELLTSLMTAGLLKSGQKGIERLAGGPASDVNTQAPLETPPAEAAPATTLPSPAAAPAPVVSHPPTFLRLANEPTTPTLPGHESGATTTYHQREDRDPGRALESLRQSASGQRPAGPGQAGGTADQAGSDQASYRLPTLDAESIENGIADLPDRHGKEHEVRFDDASNSVIKLTNPGEYGAGKGGLQGYLERLQLTNELFGDAIRVEGEVTLPGESAARVVTTQPWYRADESRPQPDQNEIDLYMRAKGFLKAYDGAYLHESRDIVASDALPKNFVRDSEGHVHPVDVMLARTTSEQEERLQNMVNNHPQHPAPPPPSPTAPLPPSPSAPSTSLRQSHPDPAQRRHLTEQASQSLESIQPGLVGKDTRFFDSTEDLLQSDYARQHPFTESQIAEIQGAEGFYDRRTGASIILAGNIQPQAGESAQAAMTRVILHERVGEGGIHRLLGVNPAQAQRFQVLAQRIPEGELRAILEEEGYAHLQGRPEDLAIEWFARRAQARPDLMQKPGLLQDLWHLLRETVADWQTRLGFSSNRGRSFDAQVESLIQRARDQAIKGRPLSAGESGQDADGFEKPRLAFSLPIRQDKPASWAAVKPGHRWMSAKKFLPKLNDRRPIAVQRGTFDAMVKDLAKELKNQPPTVQDPWGTKVLIAHPQDKGNYGDPIENLAAHLLGKDTIKGSENRVEDAEKIAWSKSILTTVQDSQARVRNGSTVYYFKSYREGVHMVITLDGLVKDHHALITQFPPNMSKYRFGDDAVVEKVR